MPRSNGTTTESVKSNTQANRDTWQRIWGNKKKDPFECFPTARETGEAIIKAFDNVGKSFNREPIKHWIEDEHPLDLYDLEEGEFYETDNGRRFIFKEDDTFKQSDSFRRVEQ